MTVVLDSVPILVSGLSLAAVHLTGGAGGDVHGDRHALPGRAGDLGNHDGKEAGLNPMALVPLCCSCSRCEHARATDTSSRCL